jgi:hypothetical protein
MAVPGLGLAGVTLTRLLVSCTFLEEGSARVDRLVLESALDLEKDLDLYLAILRFLN